MASDRNNSVSGTLLVVLGLLSMVSCSVAVVYWSKEKAATTNARKLMGQLTEANDKVKKALDEAANVAKVSVSNESGLKGQINDLTLQLDDAKKALKREQEESARKINDLNKNVADRDADLKKAADAMVVAQKEISDLKAANAVAQKTATDLKSELTSTQTKLKGAIDEASSYRIALQTREQTIQTYERKLGEQDVKLRDQIAQTTAKAEALAKVETSNKALAAEVSEMKSSMETTRKAMDELKSKLDASTKAAATAEEGLKKALADSAAANAAMTNEKDRATKLQMSLDAATKEFAKLKADYEATKKLLEEAVISKEKKDEKKK